MTTAISIENISKMYRLGQVGTGTISHDLNRWWARLRGKPDPYQRVGAENKRDEAGGDYVWALQDINLEVEQGQILGIIGRNGAGKSTLLKLLSRVTAPSTGSIRTKGRMASLLEVGTGFHPELTGRENIFLNGAILGMSRAEIKARFDEIVDFSGCAKYIDTPVKRYSSGMYVRLAFAVAAHLQPDILVVDEVLAVGDADFQAKCVDKMREECKNNGTTILFVSHSMASVSSVCSRGIVMENGGVVFDGSNIQAIDFYLDRSAQKMSESLANRRDRKGIGEIRFLESWTEDSSARRKVEFASGETIVIAAKIASTAGVSDVFFAFALYGHLGVPIADLSSRCIVNGYSVHTGEWQIRCEIPHVRLNAGTYSFDVYCKAKGVVQDCVEGAGQFAIVGSDFYGTGVMPSPEGGALLLDHNWVVAPVSSSEEQVCRNE